MIGMAKSFFANPSPDFPAYLNSNPHGSDYNNNYFHNGSPHIFIRMRSAMQENAEK
ncbi:MAG: hypothetical protein AB7E51_14945 [Pseudodesulfovibrio sp.]|uniref:hypothetical protein n=1 Tax=Pseudodesulfovibrio sp. TaxID=2035812 RepID=UPI003D0A504D